MILDWDPELESHIEGNLATEVAMIVLDTLAVVEQVVFHQSLIQTFSTLSPHLVSSTKNPGGRCSRPLADAASIGSQGDASCTQHQPGTYSLHIRV